MTITQLGNRALNRCADMRRFAAKRWHFHSTHHALDERRQRLPKHQRPAWVTVQWRKLGQHRLRIRTFPRSISHRHAQRTERTRRRVAVEMLAAQTAEVRRVVSSRLADIIANITTGAPPLLAALMKRKGTRC